MQKNINVKNVRVCKESTYIRSYKVTSNRNVNKKINKTKKKYIKITNIQKYV